MSPAASSDFDLAQRVLVHCRALSTSWAYALYAGTLGHHVGDNEALEVLSG